MPWSRSYYLILVVLLNSILNGKLPQLRTNLRLITLTIKGLIKEKIIT